VRRRRLRGVQHGETGAARAVVEIEQRDFIVAISGNRIEIVERDHVVAFECIECSAQPARGGFQRQVCRATSGCVGRRAGRQGEVGLADARRTGEEDPVRSLAGFIGTARMREFTQLRERPSGRCNEGVEALVRRVSQRQRQLRRHV